MQISVSNAGFLATVQDGGRLGYAHLGVSPCGAADQVSFRMANLLVGNEENSPALEMTLLGATLQFDEPAIVALTGGKGECSVGDETVGMWEALELPAGAVLTGGAIAGGARVYLAVQGGIEVPRVMGSAATDLRTRFGGFQGRALKRGDVLPVGARRHGHRLRLRQGALAELRSGGVIRVTRGAQQDWFSAAAIKQFLTRPYRVSESSDRAGLRLQGEPLHARIESQLLTEGVPLGAVQVPPEGQPIILFVDQQTTGGYAKIANVIAADLHRVGQLRPRDEVHFSEVSIAEAVRLLRRQEEWLRGAFQR